MSMLRDALARASGTLFAPAPEPVADPEPPATLKSVLESFASGLLC
jgi:hypothetical protein